MKFDKQKVMKVLPFIILGYFFNKVSQAFTSAAGTELGDKIMNGMDGLGEVFLNPLPSFNPIDLLIGVAGGVIVSRLRKKLRLQSLPLRLSACLMCRRQAVRSFRLSVLMS